MDNKDRGAEHNPMGLEVDVEGRSRLGLAENMLQCIVYSACKRGECGGVRGQPAVSVRTWRPQQGRDAGE
ncbi:hypothetical protein NDU88_005078 [Pleurodeles waltl]|uniref:Uncharacterized protein n=1 Tax=Pleurodeles waltl TaxID=8319 RepID=A0AAV7PEB7_PLEWA|nr:hypothetical protein NDU88_005078 [Pleurodeles waltl]